MKIVHISDMHFGPYHWSANNDILLERINSFKPDLVFNTGDSTTDSLEDEFQAAQNFLKKIQCDNVISIMGNHDKFSKRSYDFFRKYIYNTNFVEPKDKTKTKKTNIYQDPKKMNLDNYLYEANFVEQIEINGEKLLIIGLDTCIMNQHTGIVEEEILHSIADIINSTPHDRIFMLTHHSILTSDDNPLINSKIVTDFMLKYNIEASFCGHVHDLDIVEAKDIIHGGGFRQFRCGSMSGLELISDPNMYCTYENIGKEDEKITIINMYPNGEAIRFEEKVIEKI
jgi:3',5'-cyclic AMP phosphodiesterase CpdA